MQRLQTKPKFPLADWILNPRQNDYKMEEPKRKRPKCCRKLFDYLAQIIDLFVK